MNLLKNINSTTLGLQVQEDGQRAGLSSFISSQRRHFGRYLTSYVVERAERLRRGFLYTSIPIRALLADCVV